VFVIFVVCAVLLLVLISGAYVFFVACLRRKDLPWLVEEEIKKTSYGKYYPFIVKSNQWLLDHNTQDVYIASSDGLKLHGLWIPAENPKGTVLFAHGYRSTMLVDFGLAFEYYHNAGMNLLIPEQRSHGKSQGRYITFGVKESVDMQGWIAFHNREFGLYPILLSGISMGASTMMYLANEILPENVKCIIADCGFTSPKEIISKVFRSVIHLPAVPTIWVTDLFARLFAGFSLSQKDSRKTLAESRLPILMIHGTDDDFVPCEMTKQAYQTCRDPKELLLVEGAGHGVSFLVDHDHYSALIQTFLEKYIDAN